MSEARMTFLYKLAMSINSEDISSKRLQSYYLMRSKEITGGYGLPDKLYSSKKRCPHCCMEWKDKQNIMIKPMNLRRKQLLKNKSIQTSNDSRNLRWNILEQTCSFCQKTSPSYTEKPERMYPKKIASKCAIISETNKILKNPTQLNAKKTKINKKNKNVKTADVPKTIADVYSKASDIFSLKNNRNTLPSTVKEIPKIIKNNKKKKDKFAGLCQKAVLASAIAKQEVQQKKPQNKLSLLLKPSSG